MRMCGSENRTAGDRKGGGEREKGGSRRTTGDRERDGERDGSEGERHRKADKGRETERERVLREHTIALHRIQAKDTPLAGRPSICPGVFKHRAGAANLVRGVAGPGTRAENPKARCQGVIKQGAPLQCGFDVARISCSVLRQKIATVTTRSVVQHSYLH